MDEFDYKKIRRILFVNLSAEQAQRLKLVRMNNLHSIKEMVEKLNKYIGSKEMTSAANISRLENKRTGHIAISLENLRHYCADAFEYVVLGNDSAYWADQAYKIYRRFYKERIYKKPQDFNRDYNVRNHTYKRELLFKEIDGLDAALKVKRKILNELTQDIDDLRKFREDLKTKGNDEE